MSNKCLPGFVANQQQSCPDTDAVGILSITQSADKTKLYISLTDGTTQTFTLPVGVGPIGPAGAQGASGSSLIWSDPADRITGVTGSFQTVSSFSTDHTSQVDNLVNVGDCIRLYAVLQAGAAPNVGDSFMELIINGTGLSNVALNSASFTTPSSGAAEMFTDIILADKTAGANVLRIVTKVKQYDLHAGVYVTQIANDNLLPINNIGGATVDFAATNYLISLRISNATNGQVVSKYFSAEKLTY